LGIQSGWPRGLSQSEHQVSEGDGQDQGDRLPTEPARAQREVDGHLKSGVVGSASRGTWGVPHSVGRNVHGTVVRAHPEWSGWFLGILTGKAQTLTASEDKGPNARRLRPNRVLGRLARPDQFCRLIPGTWAGQPRWEEEGRVALA